MTKQTGHSIHAMELGPMQNFVYLLQDNHTGKAAIVDPAWDVNEIIKLAEQKQIQITDILLTHSHHDHVNGIEQVLGDYDAQIHLLSDEAKFWGNSSIKPTLHHGGDNIKIGDSTIEVLHTPGHTPGSACYLMGDDLIAGDTLFVFGCGRCDLSGGDPEQMFGTLRRLRTELPGKTILHPGHNYAPSCPTSTMEKQVEDNPFLHFDQKDDFVDYRMHVHDSIRDTPYMAVSKEEALESLCSRP
jgi:hydroxyacylglutathione hydrolase